ncbi:DUF1572 family protein [Ferruginibacter sp. HRS2-29]|uniref:DUF1572 family protein n=1 Tax=Ferruginibacter sp. HRS2-29 TaxID=2487334 RepID=UPI0020CF0505|nr:DUF1572 family protein [Ferruginibacter sp. HRS2-29]MCP9752275.1 DUF1572 domain-containing protein [Ferruginibacter sp. HRS2-29]
MSSINEIYLSSSIKHFKTYQLMAEKAMEQLEEEKLFISPAAGSNSIAIIVQHMAGNLLSRFTDFLTTDGEKEWRNREEEFEVVINNRFDLVKQWNKGWDCVFKALDELQPGQLSETVYIRKEAHSVLDAINRQLAHHASHVGQIVYIAKMLKGEEFESLSIPKKKNING